MTGRRNCFRAVIWLSVFIVCVAPSRGQADKTSELAIDLAILKKQGVKADAAGITGLLQSLRPSEKQSTKIASLIRDLGSDDFNKREQASAALLRLPVPPIQALKIAAKDSDPERRHRAQAILEKVEGQEPVQPLLFAAARVALAKELTNVKEELKACMPLAENPVVKRALKQAIQRKPGNDPIALPAWTDLLNSYLVYGIVEDKRTEFLKQMPTILAKQFKIETRTANTINSVASRHDTSPWLYPQRHKGELPRIIRSPDKHLYPIWGTWKQRYRDWITLNENGSHIKNAHAHGGVHYASQVQYLVIPVKK